MGAASAASVGAGAAGVGLGAVATKAVAGVAVTAIIAGGAVEAKQVTTARPGCPGRRLPALVAPKPGRQPDRRRLARAATPPDRDRAGEAGGRRAADGRRRRDGRDRRGRRRAGDRRHWRHRGHRRDRRSRRDRRRWRRLRHRHDGAVRRDRQTAAGRDAERPAARRCRFPDTAATAAAAPPRSRRFRASATSGLASALTRAPAPARPAPRRPRPALPSDQPSRSGSCGTAAAGCPRRRRGRPAGVVERRGEHRDQHAAGGVSPGG